MFLGVLKNNRHFLSGQDIGFFGVGMVCMQLVILYTSTRRIFVVVGSSERVIGLTSRLLMKVSALVICPLAARVHGSNVEFGNCAGQPAG